MSDGEILHNFSVRMKEYRTLYNLTQQDLAKLSGVTRSMIAMVENCQTMPSMVTAIKIMNALHMKTKHILGEK